jgi:hypothetical protein
MTGGILMRRIRRLLVVFALLASLVVGVSAAQAGTGFSNLCFDGTQTDVPLLSSPIAVGIEVSTGSSGTWVTVCYATSEVGYSGAELAGGILHVFVRPDGSGHVWCASDSNPESVALDCLAPFSFSPTSGGLSVTLTGTVDTNLTSPVVVGQSGLTVDPFIFIGPGVSVVPRYPCIFVLGTQIVPSCGTPII